MSRRVLRVLVVDDELPILEELRMFPFRAHGYQLVGEAQNGQEALELAHREKPDIVITDIVMPVLDGLDLVKRLRRELPHTQIILLTLYREFDYAREAIHYGVSEYLVKGIYREYDLLSALESARGRVAEEPADRHSQSRALRRVLDGEPPPAGFAGLPEFPFRLVVLRLLTRDDPEGAPDSEILRVVSKTCEATGSGVALLPGKEVHIFVRGDAHENLRVAVFRLGKELEATFDTVAAGAVIGPRVNDLDGYRRASRELAQAARMTYYAPSFDVVSARPPQLRPLRSEEALSLTLEMRKTRASAPAFAEFLRAGIPSFGFERRIEPESLSGLLETWMSELDLPYAGPKRRSKTDTVRRARPGTVFDYCESILRAAGVSPGSPQRARRPEILQVELWVSEHIDEKLTLARASEQVGLTPNYLGALFKQTTGLTFKEFVTRVRMERAGRLLRETNLLVYQIAERVGVPSYRYFTRVFRQYYEMGPQEYRSA